MNDKLQRVLTGARALESRMTDAFERTAAGPAKHLQPLELISLACDDAARHVHPAGRGRYVFPFNRVTMTFVAPTAEQQAPFLAVSDGPPGLRERLHRRLASAGCHDANVEVSTRFAEMPDPAWPRPEFHLALARVEAIAEPETGGAPRIDVRITHGTAAQEAYSFGTLPIAIGRGAEVRDGRQQLLRINHVAFTESGDEVNQSVSRRHARLEFDAHTRRVRIIDDNSAQGTVIVRGGRGIAVPRGSRGLTVQSGDELAFGKARLQITLVPPTRSGGL